MEALVVVLGLIVVPALIAALVVALVVSRRRPSEADATSEREERDEAVKAAIDHLVRMNEQMLTAERRLGTQDLEGKKSLIDHELVGMRGDLQKLTSLVHDIESERREHVGQLSSQLAEAGRNTQVLAETTQSLREALSSTTARGQWGERMADDVLRLAGLVDGVNYRRHQMIAGSGGIPDYTFMLPQGLSLHMDVKFPLNNYLKFLDAGSDVERERWRKEFLKDVRLRLKEVTGRDYVDVASNTIDCVLLFIPNEAVYAFIQEQDRTILDDALRNKVVFCSPLTLFAVLAVIRQAVDNFRLSQTTHEILGLLQGFEKQWSKFVEQMDKVGRSLKTAGTAFDDLESTRKRMLERELDKIEAVRRQQQLDAPADDDGTVTRLALEA
ncbi:MAG: DNA recombination protein RmuC [Acidimicrobiia bacterium]